jgi:hypothetical protein
LTMQLFRCRKVLIQLAENFLIFNMYHPALG